MAKKWIQKTGMKKGALHRALGVPTSQTIPDGKIRKAEHSSDPRTAHEAVLAETLKHLHHGR